MFFTFYEDKSYLLSIAKLRAFKLAYTQLFKTNELPFVLVEFAPEAYGNDAQDNLINATTMAMSAVLGGANCLIVKPTQNNEDGKRLARNIQLILKHESGLHQIADPANGSFYIESLTRKLIEKIIA
ncbi:MAG: methylmalonyl-CoA mutase family protein [Chitinophagales bacterium]|nr:methylmalonyl-CoA mutase family protein [Chitinophagales bacterium]